MQCHSHDTDDLNEFALLETTGATHRIGHHQHYEFATGKRWGCEAFYDDEWRKFAVFHAQISGGGVD